MAFLDAKLLLQTDFDKEVSSKLVQADDLQAAQNANCPALVSVPVVNRGHEPQPLHDGKTRLGMADLRKLLSEQGVKGELRREGGASALVTTGGVIVRKTVGGGLGASDFLIEGPLSDEYYTVREALYSMYQFL